LSGAATTRANPLSPDMLATLDSNYKGFLELLSEMESRLQAIELQAEAAKQDDTEARVLANAHTKEKTKDLKSLRRMRRLGSLLAILLILAVASLFFYIIVLHPEIYLGLGDPWPRLAYITGSMVLVGVLVTILLKSLYTPTAKDEPDQVSNEVVKAIIGLIPKP
jgi:hypothetical protein